MNRILALLCLIVITNKGLSQTPVPMAAQPGLTYTENFADIANWTDNFASGIGANRFASVPIGGGAAAIPNPLKITTATTTFVTGSAGGVQKGSAQATPTNSIVLLTTGTTDNTTAAAIDLFLDFTGVDAGTISFDWASGNNSAGNRKGSLRIYASIDGATFTELTSADVLNFTNNVNTSGSITTVALPSFFNNSATARLRFYYHNGVGGTTGARPKISITNLAITAVPNVACTSPTAQPTSMVFGTITDVSIDGSFTAASPAADQYLTVVSNNSSLTSFPVDGTIYNVGDPLGDGTVIANSNSLNFSATGLSPLTTYYFFSFAVRSVCIGGPKYLVSNPLTGSATTIAGFPPCTTPAAQPTGLFFVNTTVNSMQGSFTITAADEYLIIISTNPTLSSNPVNGTSYNPGDIIGNGTVLQRNNTNNFTASSLSPNTTYYFYIFSINSQNCINGPVYNSVNPLTGNNATLPLSACTTPSAQPSGISLYATVNAISGTFNTGFGADTYLTVMSLSPSLSSFPVNNTDYNPGDPLGGGTVVANSATPNFIASSLSAGTTYYFFIFSANKNCSGGTKYLIPNPLTGNITTSIGPGNNYYFGNIHSHSRYSDGNQDNPAYTPAQDYSYAMLSQCMDFLGISEHNHYGAGTLLSDYHLGVAQANSFNASNPNFIALYGMEWGVISNGGHVLVYGDGMNNLWGWETNVGSVPGNNYDLYVAKSDYTGANGLFKTINDNIATNTFGSLAHPNSSDFNNLANVAYDVVADNAISAVAVESGPATSTNTTYSNPGSSYAHLMYYQKLLSKGYHLGPAIDHDNHNTTFGRTTYSRTAVIAPVLSRTEIIKAYRNMHFYATQDCDTKVDFSINTRIMGSVLTDRYAPEIRVSLSDATTSVNGAVIKIMFGIPGSGVLPAQIYSATGSSMNFTDNNLVNLSTGYYYADISNGSSRIITSPIWYTRNDINVLPVQLGNFLVKKLDNRVQLNWSTEQEINSSHFIIERSADGRNWNSIINTNAAGNSSIHIAYQAFDNDPLNGMNYYRLKQVDRDNRFQLSPVRNVYFETPFDVQLSPNPARDFINIKFLKINTGITDIQVLDINGKLLHEEKTNKQSLVINISGLQKGIYFIKIVNGSGMETKKLVIQ